MNSYRNEWCGGLSRVDRKQISCSVLAFLIQHNPNVSKQILGELALILEENAYNESACPTYYIETLVTKLHNVNASMTPTIHRQNSNSEQHVLCEEDWRKNFTAENRDAILRHMVFKLTTFNQGKSAQEIAEAATVFESCTFISADSKLDYITNIAQELASCDTNHTLPAPSAEVLALLQQCQNQSSSPQPETTQTQPFTGSPLVPSAPTGPQNILNLEPGELLSSLFEQPNWKTLLSPADRETIVRHIYSKLHMLNRDESERERFQRAISLELDAYTRAETGCSYLEQLIAIIGRLQLQHDCVSEVVLSPQRNEGQGQHATAQTMSATLFSSATE